MSVNDEIPPRFYGMADEAHRIVPELESTYADESAVRIDVGTQYVTIEIDHDAATTTHLRRPADPLARVDWPVPVSIAAVSVDTHRGVTAIKVRADEEG